MLHREDEVNLGRILRVSQFSDQLLAEYEIRVRMYHACGASGALGPLALIDMVRSMKLTPTVVKEAPAKVDWRQVPRNGTIRIKAMFFGDWQLGTYYGFGDDGALEVKMDHDDYRRQMPRHAVQLADNAAAVVFQQVEDQVYPALAEETMSESDTDVFVDPNQDEAPDVIPFQTFVPRPERPSVGPPSGDDTPYQQHDGGALAEIASSEAMPVAVAVSSPVEPEAMPIAVDDVDWSAIEVGRAIWVDVDGDLSDAKFQGLAPDNQMTVLVDGEESTRIVPCGTVLLV